jgi:hypothetical protein
LDDCCDTGNSVAAGLSEQLHNGRVYSRPAGDCHCRGAGQYHSGAKTFGIKEGRAVTKEARMKIYFLWLWLGYENKKIVKEV